MTHERDDGPPSSLRRFLEAERERPPVPETDIDRILDSVVSTPIPTPSGTPTPSSASTSLSIGERIAAWAPSGIPTLLVGIALGVGGTAVFDARRVPPPRERISETRTPSAEIAAPLPSTNAAQPDAAALAPAPASPAQAATTQAPVTRESSRPASSVDGSVLDSTESASGGERSLVDERRLLEAARAALARGAWDAALTSVRIHAQRYPHGTLAEEREAARVQALAGAGRLDEAREAARAFEARYPGSLQTGAVRRALRGATTPESGSP